MSVPHWFEPDIPEEVVRAFKNTFTPLALNTWWFSGNIEPKGKTPEVLWKAGMRQEILDFIAAGIAEIG